MLDDEPSAGRSLEQKNWGSTVRWVAVLVALALRFAVAIATRHSSSDMQFWLATRRAFLRHGLQMYSRAAVAYPYPPLFILFMVPGIWIGDHLGIPRDIVLKLPIIFADACLVLLVTAELERRGASQRLVTVSASLLVFGPTFVVLSGYHGHFDSLAILPAAIAAVLWERSRARSRALACGALIGVGAATKTIPGVIVLALIPTARSRRELAMLACAAVAVPLAAILPFALVDRTALTSILTYGGLPGLGGWSVFVQPAFVRWWLLEEPTTPSSVTLLFFEYGSKLTLAIVIAVGVILLRRGWHPIEASCLLWHTVYASAVNLFPGYMNWAIPFLLMSGRVAEVALLSLLLVPITILAYVRPAVPAFVVPIYQALAMALQAFLVAMWARDVARLWRAH